MKTFWIILLLLLPLSMIAAEDEGDDGFCGCLLDACFQIGGELFLEYAIHLRFAPYPYAPSVGYIFSTLDYHDFGLS